MIPITSKTENKNNTFRDIIYILKNNGISIDKISKRFMVDFEKSLLNSVKGNFPNATIDGWFSHYSKLLWTKARLLGLFIKDNLKKTKILIFILKLLLAYIDLSQEEYLMRTNNYIERFQGLLNQSLETINPKISYLIYKYGEYLKNINTKITNSLINKIKEKEDKFSVIIDILSFIE